MTDKKLDKLQEEFNTLLKSYLKNVLELSIHTIMKIKEPTDLLDFFKKNSPFIEGQIKHTTKEEKSDNTKTKKRKVNNEEKVPKKQKEQKEQEEKEISFDLLIETVGFVNESKNIEDESIFQNENEDEDDNDEETKEDRDFIASENDEKEEETYKDNLSASEKIIKKEEDKAKRDEKKKAKLQRIDGSQLSEFEKSEKNEDEIKTNKKRRIVIEDE